MDAGISARRAARAVWGQVVISVAISVALLAAAAAAIYSSLSSQQLQKTYNAAPVCRSLSDALAAGNCRYTDTGTIIDISGGDGIGTTYYVLFVLPGDDSRSFKAKFDPSISLGPVALGDNVPVEFWSGRVTKLDGANTVDNPTSDRDPADRLVIGIILGLLGGGAMILSVLMVRRARRGDQDESPTLPTMNPVATSDALWR